MRHRVLGLLKNYGTAISQDDLVAIPRTILTGGHSEKDRVAGVNPVPTSLEADRAVRTEATLAIANQLTRATFKAMHRLQHGRKPLEAAAVLPDMDNLPIAQLTRSSFISRLRRVAPHFADGYHAWFDWLFGTEIRIAALCASREIHRLTRQLANSKSFSGIRFDEALLWFWGRLATPSV